MPRPDQTINIQQSIVFPGFVPTTPIGNITLTLQPNCASLETIFITASPPKKGNTYFIEFTNSATVGVIYIGEVIFRDQVTQNQACKSISPQIFILFQYCLHHMPDCCY